MRIVNFISGDDLGGPKQSFLHYTDALQRLEYKVFSVIRKNSPLRPLLEDITRSISELSYVRTTFFPFSKLASFKLRRAISPLNPDLVIVHKQIDIELVRKALGKDVNIVGVIHGYNSRHIEFADALIAVSDRVRKFLLESDYRGKVIVIPNMVNMNGAEPEYKKIGAIPRLGTMGMFRRKKGMDVFIKSLAILKNRGVNYRASIAGKGYLRSKLVNLVEQLGLEEEISIRQWLRNDQKTDYIDSLDFFVLPSRSETFGMVVVEAMARKKIVIATKCGGPEEIIENGLNGFLVDNDSPEAMADKIISLLDKPESLGAVSSQAYETAKTKYCIDSVIPTLKRFLSGFESQ